MENIKKLEKIIVINDNVEDINELRKVLPSEVKVKEMSQFEGSLIKRVNQYDLIVLDNDANEARESKGKETLKQILKRKISIPIVYTSQSPAWIDKEVSNNSRVTIIKTSDLPNYLSNIYGIPIKQLQEDKKEGKTSIIVTYNNVDNYKPGIYDNGKLLIVSDTKRTFKKAPEVTQKNLEKIFGTFDFRKDKDKIKDIYVYVGLNAIEEPLRLAMSLAHDVRKQVYVMACDCSWKEKVERTRGLDIILHKVWCGGSYDLMQIADNILGRYQGKKIQEKK